MRAEVLALLKQNQDGYLSGQVISERLGVTRAAVWKTIKQLQNEGYGIASMTKNGYRLTECPDLLTAEELSPLLSSRILGRRIVHFDTTVSTNLEARKLAEAGEPEGTVVLAEEQTGGRGKLGRPWASPPRLGIWMSVLLRPPLDMTAGSLLTLAGCAAVWRALSPLTADVYIKWPNDVLLHGRKLCGILTESCGELDHMDYLILGIGVNVNQTAADFPADLQKNASSLRIALGKALSRQKLTAAILAELEACLHSLQNEDGAHELCRFCWEHTRLPQQPLLCRRNSQVPVQILGFSDAGQLLVQYPDGHRDTLLSGDLRSTAQD